MTDYEQRLQMAANALERSERVIIGGGSGLSAAAGLSYSGKRFEANFPDFIEKYGFTDMYTASFYPFATEEERWAHWARHIFVNRFAPGATQLYRSLLELVGDKPYFVITTNVESQFEKAGFSTKRIFEVQGNYAYIQCSKACHPKLYYNEPLVMQLLEKTRDCKIPTELAPKCPVCGGPMDVNLRKDAYFVEDEAWRKSCARYEAFVKEAYSGRATLLELGVGYNTPGIIRYPFEQMAHNNSNWTLVRLNRDFPQCLKGNEAKTVAFSEDMQAVITALGQLANSGKTS